MNETFKNKVKKSQSFYNEEFLDFDYKLNQFNHKTLSKYFKGDSCLELGPALGQMTRFLVKDFKQVDIVDGSEYLLNQVPEYNNVRKYHSYFEEFIPTTKYETIIMSHVLEHIEYPVEVLKRIKHWVSKDGVIIISVPNAESIHRKAAVHMGLLDSVYELNERDHQLGHYRVYDLESLIRDVSNAGFTVLHSGGIFLKPLSNGQIEQNWTDSMINAFYELGKDMPRNCAEIFVVLKNK